MMISINIAAVFETRPGSDFPDAASGKFTFQYPGEHRAGKRPLRFTRGEALRLRS